MTGTITPTATERRIMAEINAWAAQIGAEEGKPAFTAAILKDDREVVRGRNTVGQDQDATRHAEVVAIGKAGAKNAGLMAASILALSDTDLADRLRDWRAAQTDSIGHDPKG